MFDEGLTDNEFTPVPPVTAVPPQLTVYQSVVSPPPGLVTERVVALPLQTVAGLALIPLGAAGIALMVSVSPRSFVRTGTLLTTRIL